MPVTRVEGTKKEHKVFIYTLTTCGWCKRTKEMLKEAGVEYEYLDVDVLKADERQKAIEDLRRRNAPIGFPVIIVDDSKVITGYDPVKIKEALGLS
jgi:glutaredoxin-like protein NrdH